MDCNCPTLASTAIAEEELMKKNLSANVLDSNGDKEKTEEFGGDYFVGVFEVLVFLKFFCSD